MFKKLKDKLAEEVKSSPQRIQQFAQAAQAAVTSASSSISDITNSDLFSIGDNESHQGRPVKSLPGDQTSTVRDVSLVQPGSMQASIDSMDFVSSQDLTENHRQRRLSNSSFASDVSFRLPSYESPSMYHLQSDIEVSASEAEERGFSSGNVSLDRVTKEQIYAAYRRTQERYTKYRTQYADLARHYKLLERENAKARSVLVETQDKALRRISELREQCSLEQSAKAHLEKALRVEIEEKNLKIDTLNTKIKLLQNNVPEQKESVITSTEEENNVHLISFDSENNQTNDESSPSETLALANKIEKLENLLSKYKDSLKTSKDKNAQLTTEIQILSSELETKNREINQLNASNLQLEETKQKVQELNDLNEELQNKINAFDFNKTKELSTLEIDLQKAQEEITQLRSKIEVFTKREEENAISLAENKLSIHKELESKETEIKSLKDRLSESNKEVQSLNIVINDYRNSISKLEDECSKLKRDINELDSTKAKLVELESQVQATTHKCQALETFKLKADEEYKCLQLQLKQEAAEKLAMIDRNTYLENRNAQLSEDNARKSSQLSILDNELQTLKKETENVIEEDNSERSKMIDEINLWKNKYSGLESEIQEERDELVKLQSEIEKLLANHELIQLQNSELTMQLKKLNSENEKLTKKQSNLLASQKLLQDQNIELNMQLTKQKSENEVLTEKQSNWKQFIKSACNDMILQIKDLQSNVTLTSQEIKSLKQINNDELTKSKENIVSLLLNFTKTYEMNNHEVTNEENDKHLSETQSELQQITEKYCNNSKELALLKEENNKLKSENDNISILRHDLDEKIRHISEEYKNKCNELMLTKNEKENLTTKLDELQFKCQGLQNSINGQDKDKLSLTQEITNLVQKLNNLEHECKISNNKIKNLEEENESKLNELNSLKEEKEMLLTKLQVFEENQIRLENLQQVIKDLSQENVQLKTQSELIANSVKELEVELRDVRKSHVEIEVEKDHLTNIIEQLEKNEREKEVSDKELQTDELLKVTNTNLLANDSDETFDKLQISELTQEKSCNKKTEAYNLITHDNDLLKEENKRLQSDVVGLQTYLAKISKENSDLNDKLRELIATSENVPAKDEILNKNLSDLKTEIQSEKDRLDDLIRENNLLVEENLELKDQLNSHNYPKMPQDDSKELDYSSLKEKYRNLLDINSRLESRMMDLENINKSVNGNVQQMQQNNDKLKLSNEKLERRLDEALVSLRHLHSLQENTELEYLRNILYEYLTGTGTHSITLAKVLAAVVKFDDSQTQAILQKEKERQGFLRQLGLL